MIAVARRDPAPTVGSSCGVEFGTFASWLPVLPARIQENCLLRAGNRRPETPGSVTSGAGPGSHGRTLTRVSEHKPIVPPAVLDAFGVEGDEIALGGEGVCVRIGDVVLKRVHDVDEADWTQALLSRVDEDDFRIAHPVPTLTGRWTHEGWSASQFVDGLRSVAPAWPAVAAIGLRFSDAAEAARDGGAETLAARTHRWALADRFAWGETHINLRPEATDVGAELVALLGDPPADRQVIHGDLTGNVYVDRDDLPVVLDFSPYLRPREWAVAIMVADAVLWNGADLLLAESFAATAGRRDLLGRALLFRMVAEQLAAEPRHGAHLGPYRRVLSALRDPETRRVRDPGPATGGAAIGHPFV
jgi:uncharacterized protein (TIGR02569 family)